MIPSIGRIVHYTLSATDAEQINRRRHDATDKMGFHVGLRHGAQLHVGNPVMVDDVYPLIITRVWSNDAQEDTCVNGQVLLDGNDTLWVTSVQQGDGTRTWRAPFTTP